MLFRILLGSLILLSSVRFLYLGRLKDQYLDTSYRFSYYGFGCVQPLAAWAMYSLYAVLVCSSIAFVFGYKYKWSSALLFLSFTYVELIDKAYYLNHYYLVSVLALLMACLPAQAAFSIDAYQSPSLQKTLMPAWMLNLLRVQIALVYLFAGLWKIQTHWLLEAMPLKLWLPAHSDMPLLGPLFDHKATPYVFAWSGMLYDLCIPFALLWTRTRAVAFGSVVVFHCLTGYLFQIGVFPLVMICASTLFFSQQFHLKLLGLLQHFWSRAKLQKNNVLYESSGLLQWGLGAFMCLQFLLPLRSFLYSGNTLWTEEGYRFAWRVMLVEKAGHAQFIIRNPKTGAVGAVDNAQFLNMTQEKQMSFQPDMILEFAHHLANHYEKRLSVRPEVYAEVYVTMNGQSSRLLIDPKVNLVEEKETLTHKSWICE